MLMCAACCLGLHHSQAAAAACMCSCLGYCHVVLAENVYVSCRLLCMQQALFSSPNSARTQLVLLSTCGDGHALAVWNLQHFVRVICNNLANCATAREA